MPLATIKAQVLPHYKNLGNHTKISMVLLGQINQTFLVETDKGKFILQQLSPIFTKEVMEDASAVAAYLEGKDFLAPTLLPTDEGSLWIEVSKALFRALKYIEGKCYKTVSSKDMAKEAGVALAKFHLTLNDFQYEYKSKRRHGGDYQFHAQNLWQALTNFTNHDYYDRVANLSKLMLPALESITNGYKTTPRHAHGDPKISNLIFNDLGKAVSFIDFDTLSKTGWSLELADAIRSWCNPNTEDAPSSFLDLDLVEQVIGGYGSLMRGYFTDKEKVELEANLLAITLCLSIRYATDTLEESLFLHDQDKFKRPADHTWLKALSTYNLYLDIIAKREQLKMLISHL